MLWPLRSRSGAGAPARLLGGAAAVVMGSLLALSAHASISGVNPASGEVPAGDSISATVTIQAPTLATCLSATSSSPLNITVVVDGLGLVCETGSPWVAEMIVTASASTPPGEYTVTLTEVDLLGNLVETRQWPLTVTEQQGPATSSTSTTTPTASTSTTSSNSATTSTPGTTTTSEDSSSSGATTSPPTTKPPAVSGGAVTKQGEPAVSTGGSGPPVAATTIHSTVVVAAEEDAENTSSPVDEVLFSEIAVTSRMFDLALSALPPVFVEALASPFVLVEVLVRAMARTTLMLLVPAGLTLALGAVLFWRLSTMPSSTEAGRNGETT